MLYKQLIYIFSFLITPFFCDAQTLLEKDVYYGIQVNYPALSVTKDKLCASKTLADLKTQYEASWIKKYLSVEIRSIVKGVSKSSFGINDTLTIEQKKIMKSADVGSPISVFIKYIPDNNLDENDPKEISFSFLVNPDVDACFDGGEKALNAYLKEHIITHIPDSIYSKYQLTAFTFTVDKHGLINEININWPTKNPEIDNLIKETICAMPDWKPAEYLNGTKVSQELVLMIGDRESCVSNLYNIKD